MPANCKGNPPEERPPECLCFLDTENPNEVFMQALIAGEGEGFLMAFQQLGLASRGDKEERP
jgi:hypothetical protein